MEVRDLLQAPNCSPDRFPWHSSVSSGDNALPDSYILTIQFQSKQLKLHVLNSVVELLTSRTTKNRKLVVSVIHLALLLC
jgi:hypothetical protein